MIKRKEDWMRNENRFGLYRRGQKNLLRNLFCSLLACLFGFLIIFLLSFRSNVGWGWEKMPKTRIFTVLSLYQYLRITASDFGHCLFQCFDILLHIISHCSHLGKQILLARLPLSCLFCLFVCLFVWTRFQSVFLNPRTDYQSPDPLSG